MIALGGDIRFIGWDANAELAADRYDQLTQIVAAFGKGAVADAQIYPRPGVKSAEADDSNLFAPTIDDFDPAAFMRVIAGR